MSSLQFGGALTIFDPASRKGVALRCWGQLELVIHDQAAFEREIAHLGATASMSSLNIT